MLAERANALAGRITALQSWQQQQEDAQRFQTRAEELRGPAEKLTGLAKTLALFRQEGVGVTLDEGKRATLATRVAERAAEFQATPESILKADGDLRFAFWQTLERFPGEVQAALKTAWEAYVDGHMPKGNPERLNVLSRVPGFVQPVQEIREGHQKAIQRRAQLPQSAADFSAIRTLAANQQKAWDQLQEADAVMTFLRAAAAEQATLEHVTPGVRLWLEQHKLLKSFKVKL